MKTQICLVYLGRREEDRGGTHVCFPACSRESMEFVWSRALESDPMALRTDTMTPTLAPFLELPLWQGDGVH